MMVTKLAISSPTIVVASLETLVEPLRATVSATLKENAVKQQQERHEELLRSGMRAIRALEKMPDAERRAPRGSGGGGGRRRGWVREGGLRVQGCGFKGGGAVSSIPPRAVHSCLKFDEFMKSTLKSSGKLAEKYQAVCADADTAEDRRE